MEILLEARRLIEREVRLGRLILFTGAGFSMDALSRDGQRVPGVAELRAELSAIALPDFPSDDDSSLEDLYQVALTQGRSRVKALLDERFTVAHKGLPEAYRTWFSFPWQRAYTLNVDTLADAANQAFGLPRQVESLGVDAEASSPRHLPYIHLHGRLTDFPALTFGVREYARRQALPDLLYARLAADLTTHPTIFVGTTLDESPLWQYVEMRNLREARARELRPRSYLVTPSLPAARAALLHQYNVMHIPMTQAQFAESVLAPMENARLEGLALFSDARYRSPSRLKSVHTLRGQGGPARADFLMGREPAWTDLTDGFAIEREFEKTTLDPLVSTDVPLIVLTGTAGSGKSTTLMRLALTLDAQGRSVSWLDAQDDEGLQGLRDAVRVAAPDVLAIDNIDVYGHGAGPFMADLVERASPNLLIAAMRGTRYEQLQVESALKDCHYGQVVVPNLEDSDISLLVNALTRANRLGDLRGKSVMECHDAFRRRAGRQLLVALLSATSGRDFEEKIESECQELPADLSLLYAIIALATHLGGFVTPAEVVMATGDVDNETLNALRRLQTQQLVTSRGNDRLRVRHRLIADRVVDWYSRNGQLREPAAGLLFALASEELSRPPHTRTRASELLWRLLSHSTLARLLGQNAADVRSTYQEVEVALGSSYHFWLQRGSFEIESGSLDLAENYLNQARAIDPSDYKGDTAWGYLLLKKAAVSAPAPGAYDLAEAGIGQLLAVIAARGDDDPYPHHILGSQGLRWVRRAALSPTERRRKLEKLLAVVKRARVPKPLAKDLEQLEADLQREYLMTAVVDGSLEESGERPPGQLTLEEEQSG